ncbi:MAG: hypothetical protein RMK02_11170, partial [Burkholderiales bacterium]|nr:hypothetical protein [Burkholderiales bacterium]
MNKASKLLLSTAAAVWFLLANAGATAQRLDYDVEGFAMRIGLGITDGKVGHAELRIGQRFDNRRAVVVDLYAQEGSSVGLKLAFNLEADSPFLRQLGQVQKIIIAYDDSRAGSKATIGLGAESANMHWGLTVSRRIDGHASLTIQGNTLIIRPWDWGVGLRGGTTFLDGLGRLTAGLDYEWGKQSS